MRRHVVDTTNITIEYRVITPAIGVGHEYRRTSDGTVTEAATPEMSNRVERRGSADVADNARSALEVIDRNEEFIKMTLAVMMAPE